MPTSFFEKSSPGDPPVPSSRIRSILLKIQAAARRTPLVVLALSAILGIAGSDRDAWILLAIAGLVGMALTFATWKRDRLTFPLAAGGLIALLLFAGLHERRLNAIQKFPFASELARGTEVEIKGEGWIADRVEFGERSSSTQLHVESVSLRGVEIACDHRVPVWIQKATSDFAYGDRVKFSGFLRPLESATAPGGFDPAAFYFREAGSLARLEIREGDDLEKLPGNAGSKLISIAQQWRDRLEEGLFAGVSTDQMPYARLISAMSLGARENTPEDLEKSFRRSGTMHLFAVSGLHVGVVAGLLLGVLLLSRVPRRTAVLIVIPLVLFYAVLTGLRPSAIRAAIMLSVILASFAVKEKPNLLNSLALAALIILGFDTQQLFLPGFQLSFAVLLFITLFAAPMQKWFSGPWLTDPFIPKTLRGPFRRMKDRFVTGLSAALAVSLVSWLGSLGLLVWHFQSYAPIGVLANVFMVPLASIVVSLAVVSLGSFSIHATWLTGWLNQLNVGLTVLLTTLAQFFGGLPGAYQNSGNVTGALPQVAPEALTMHVISEQGGGAVLLEIPAHNTAPRSLWMIDPGGPATYRRQMLPLLRSKGIDRIDVLVLTHGDVAHIGEASTVLAQFRPGILFESPLPNRSPAYAEIDETAKSEKVQRFPLERGQRLRPHPEVTLRVLAPDPKTPGRIADDHSLVFALEYREMRILLTADAGFETEKQLLASGKDLSADLWIRGQHIDSPSGLPAFVDAVSPKVVISSSSEFPAAQRISPTLQRVLQERDTTLLPLDETGVVTLQVFPDRIEVLPFRKPGSRIVVSPENL
ncbi:MAG: ComEC/Rec2 family competence protein [Verrucomicrobiota bacterium]